MTEWALAVMLVLVVVVAFVVVAVWLCKNIFGYSKLDFEKMKKKWKSPPVAGGG